MAEPAFSAMAAASPARRERTRPWQRSPAHCPAGSGLPRTHLAHRRSGPGAGPYRAGEGEGGQHEGDYRERAG